MKHLVIGVGSLMEANCVGQQDDAIVVVAAGNPTKFAADVRGALDAGCTHVISVGMCGALDPTLKAGAVVVGGMVVNPPTSQIICDEPWSGKLWRYAGAKIVTATYSPTTVATSAGKVALFARTGADVVDCETWIAGSAAKERGVPFAMLRTVSDEADQDIPPAALAALNTNGGVDVWSFLTNLIAALPKDHEEIPEIMRLIDTSTLASNALVKALTDITMNYAIE